MIDVSRLNPFIHLNILRQKMMAGFLKCPDWLMILFGLVLGSLSGAYMGPAAAAIEPIGKMFLNAVMSLVSPVVFVSLVVGISSMQDTKKMGRILFRALLLYFLSMAAFSSFSLVLAHYVFKPGQGVFDVADFAAPLIVSKSVDSPTFLDMVAAVVPKNVLAAFVEGNILQVIFCAIVFGLALNFTGDQGKPVRDFFDSLSKVLFKAVGLIMKAAPIGVFALTHHVVGIQGLDVLGALFYFVFVLYFCALSGMLTIYGLGLLLYGIHPKPFFKKMFEVQTIAFSTASSAACLPSNISVCSKKLGVSKSITSFLLPLGSSMNMNGLACYMGIVAIFTANLYGVHLTGAQMIQIVFTSAVASMGCAGVPAAGLFVMPVVLTSVGLPLEVVGLVAAVDRLVDMMTTTVNVSGDTFAALLVAKREGELDSKVYGGSTQMFEAATAQKSLVENSECEV